MEGEIRNLSSRPLKEGGTESKYGRNIRIEENEFLSKY